MKRSWEVFEGLTNDEYEQLESIAEAYHYSNVDIEYAESGDPVFEYQRHLFAEIASILFSGAECEFHYHEGRMFPYSCSGVLIYKSGRKAKSLGESRISYLDALRSFVSRQASAILPD